MHKSRLKMSAHADVGVYTLAFAFAYTHALCMRTAKALGRLGGCTGSSDPWLLADALSTKNNVLINNK